MSYALVVDNVIQAETGLPSSARRLDTGAWVLGLGTASVALRQACGYYEVVNTLKPADTATDTFDRTVALVAGVPTVVWVQRAKTPAEVAAATADANAAAINARAQTNIEALKTIKNSSGTLTGAQLSNAVRALAAADLDVIRYLHRQLDQLD